MLLNPCDPPPVLTWKSGWRSMNLENWAFMASTRLDSMSWQCRGVRYSSTSTAVACSMLRRLRTPRRHQPLRHIIHLHPHASHWGIQHVRHRIPALTHVPTAAGYFLGD